MQNRCDVEEPSSFHLLPGEEVRAKGQNSDATEDEAVNEAYDIALEVLKFYKQVFNYDWLDGQGIAISSSVHFGQKLGNAFWLGGEWQMMYGDGNSFLHNFTKCVDVIGHEITVSRRLTRKLWRRRLTIVDTARCDSVKRRARLPRQVRCSERAYCRCVRIMLK